MAKLRPGKLSEFKTAQENANKHTERGLYELEKSIRQDGFVAPMTVAADGEALDGSARMEKSADLFDQDVIVVEHDGTKPIVMVRTDIPDAKNSMAKRIAIRANRVAQLDLDWDPKQLLQDGKEIDLGKLWTQREWKDLIEGVELPNDGQDSGAESEKSEEEDGCIICPKCGYHLSNYRVRQGR